MRSGLIFPRVQLLALCIRMCLVSEKRFNERAKMNMRVRSSHDVTQDMLDIPRESIDANRFEQALTRAKD